MEARLPENAGTLKTVCHPPVIKGVQQPYPDDAPAACKKGTCKHKWIGRWHDGLGRQPKRIFKDRKAGETELLAVYARRERQSGRATMPKGKVPTLKTYGDEWLADLDGPSGTKRTYTSLLTKHAYPSLGKKSIDSIKHSTIEDLIKSLESTDKKVREAPLGGSSVDGLIRSVLYSIFQKAIDKDGWIHDNPCKNQKIKSAPKVKRYIPTTTEVHKIAHDINGFWRLAVYLMSAAGLRQGEVLGFTVDCVQGDRLRIYQQRAHGDTHLTPLKHRKAGDERWIPLDPMLKAEIERHMDEFGITKGLLFPAPKTPDVSYSYSTMDRRLNQTMLRLGLYKKDITAHNFRHFFASNCVARGVEIAEVSLMLGHANIQVTFEAYYQLPKEYKRITAAINYFMSADIPDNVVMLGTHAFAPTDIGARLSELMAEIQALTGMQVRLEPLALAA